MNPWYVYIAETQTGLYYVGITTDPIRRLKDHNVGRGARLAKSQGPFILRYISPPLPDQSTARKKEMEMKKWKHDKKEQLIQGKIMWQHLIFKSEQTAPHPIILPESDTDLPAVNPERS